MRQGPTAANGYPSAAARCASTCCGHRAADTVAKPLRRVRHPTGQRRRAPEPVV